MKGKKQVTWGQSGGKSGPASPWMVPSLSRILPLFFFSFSSTLSLFLSSSSLSLFSPSASLSLSCISTLVYTLFRSFSLTTLGGFPPIGLISRSIHPLSTFQTKIAPPQRPVYPDRFLREHQLGDSQKTVISIPIGSSNSFPSIPPIMDTSDVTDHSLVPESGVERTTHSPSNLPETHTPQISPASVEHPESAPGPAPNSHPRAPTPPPTAQPGQEIEHAYWADIEEDRTTPSQEELKEINGAEADYSACDCRSSPPLSSPEWQI